MRNGLPSIVGGLLLGHVLELIVINERRFVRVLRRATYHAQDQRRLRSLLVLYRMDVPNVRVEDLLLLQSCRGPSLSQHQDYGFRGEGPFRRADRLLFGLLFTSSFDHRWLWIFYIWRDVSFWLIGGRAHCGTLPTCMCHGYVGVPLRLR